MDIARPEFKLQKRRRQIVLVGSGAVLVAAVSIGVMRLKPAAPSVERGTVWTDVVKRGSMLRQVRGPGSLIPAQEAVRQIPAETLAYHRAGWEHYLARLAIAAAGGVPGPDPWQRVA